MRTESWSAQCTTVAVACVALVVGLSACGSSKAAKSTPTTLGSQRATPDTATFATNASNRRAFTLAAGVEHDVCGIGIIVRFIPSNASASTADEAVLEGGPVSNVQDLVQNHTGDQPLPSNAAEAKEGAIVTVVGRRFKVDVIDVPNSRVQLEALC
jgi:hypothetical protein